jgi:hypothetical protein
VPKLMICRTYALIRNGEIVVVGTDMPYLMYRDGHVYNKDDMEDGLLEGTTLFAVRFLLHARSRSNNLFGRSLSIFTKDPRRH